MTDAGLITIAASLLAAISTATFICAAFYPLIFRPPLSDRRSAVFEALLKGRQIEAPPATRSIRRAQEAALKSVQPGSAKRRSQIEIKLDAAGVDCSPQRYLVVCFMLGGLIFRVALLFGLSPSIALGIAGLGAWLLPQRYLAARANKRRRAFLAAFSNAVDMIVRGAKSGLSLMDCLAMVASDAASPVREEFETIVAQLRAGIPLPQTMEKLAAAMPAPEVRFFVMIMSAQSQTGGNLGEALANLSGVLRDREKIASKIRISSAEGRASALIIGALPFVVIGATAVVAPNYLDVLWADEAGRRVAAFCVVWLAAGVFVLSQMARIDV